GALYHTRKCEQIRPRLTTAGWANCVVTASPDLQAQDLLKIVDAQRALAYGPAAHAAGRLEPLHRSHTGARPVCRRARRARAAVHPRVCAGTGPCSCAPADARSRAAPDAGLGIVVAA